MGDGEEGKRTRTITECGEELGDGERSAGMRGQGANGREGDRENPPSSVFLLLAAGAPSLALLMADAPLLDPLGCTHTHTHTHTQTQAHKPCHFTMDAAQHYVCMC